MNPMHIDRVNVSAKKNILAPGPGNYELPQTFGNNGLKKSFGTRLEML